MGKVVWIDARLEFLMDTSVTYGSLAKKYGVSPSTIQRRAIRDGWLEERELVLEKVHKNALKLGIEEKAQIDERHLARYRLMQQLSNRIIYDTEMKAQEGTADSRDYSASLQATTTLFKAIMAERSLLGLTTRPVVFRDPEQILEYQRNIGMIPAPINQDYKDAVKEEAMLDQFIKRRQKLRKYIKDTNERGTYEPFS